MFAENYFGSGFVFCLLTYGHHPLSTHKLMKYKIKQSPTNLISQTEDLSY